jgi:isochorismate hydrolase
MAFSFSTSLGAFDTRLLDIRNKLFDESKRLQLFVQKSNNPLLISGVWDSCVVTATQLDAYFHMLGIFNTITSEETSHSAIDFLTSWLMTIRKINSANIKNVDTILPLAEEEVRVRLKIVRGYYSELDSLLGTELDKVSTIKKSLRLRR